MSTRDDSDASRAAITVIGIDAAADAKNVGLAYGVVEGGRLRLREVCPGVGKQPELVERIVAWVRPPALLAIDAPLGWPRALGQELHGHRAGQPLAAGPNELFRRVTDREIQARFKVTPLDVGADRIARTARAALDLLAQLRRRLGRDIPLLWSPAVSGVGAIEVYPAATIVARKRSRIGYKKDLALREALLGALMSELGVIADAPAARAMLGREHGLDAALCVLAGFDFIAGRARGPDREQRELAELEGWIWARSP